MASKTPLNLSAKKFKPININMEEATRGDIALVREQTAQSLVLFQNSTAENFLTLREVGSAMCYALDSAMLCKDQAMYLAETSAYNATLAGNTAHALANTTDTQATMLSDQKQEISYLRSKISSLMLGKCPHEKPATEKKPATKCTNANPDHVKAFHSS